MSSEVPAKIQNQVHVARLLVRISRDPPSSLVLEGGTPGERSDLAEYMLQALHCRNPGLGACLECDLCHKIQARVFRDLYWLNPLEGLAVDEVREMRPILAQSPHHFWRMVVVEEAAWLNAACANALLKSVEEPVSRNIFVFLTNDRENILTTIVSRSFVLTLGRKTTVDLDSRQQEIYMEFLRFIQTSKGFMDISSKKDFMDLPTSRLLISRIRMDLLRGMRGEDTLFQSINPLQAHSLVLCLQKAEQSLDLKVRTDLVMQWLALNIWKILSQDASV